jgi:hypothetical protein
MRELVFVHGRSQEDKDPAELKETWIEAFKAGLAKSGRQLPIPEDSIRFPYYGDTLRDLVTGIPDDEVAAIIVKGDEADAEEREFVRQYVLEVQNALKIDEQQIRAVGGQTVVQKGPLNWEWLQTVLQVIDQRVPGASGATLALSTKDVYAYLRNPGLQSVIDSGVRSAFTPNVEQVVVSHSLGTVVAYNLIRRDGGPLRWKIPLFVTLGSPLGVNVIKTSLAPLKHPSSVAAWFNAMDERDVVALYPLDSTHFDVSPAIENKTDVNNHTDNRHGIAGYLDDEVVAAKIHDALVA